jgi:hypothetical protein
LFAEHELITSVEFLCKRSGCELTARKKYNEKDKNENIKAKNCGRYGHKLLFILCILCIPTLKQMISILKVKLNAFVDF